MLLLDRLVPIEPIATAPPPMALVFVPIATALSATPVPVALEPPIATSPVFAAAELVPSATE
jgi:hypothetical protein